MENGIVGREALLRQVRAAHEAIEKHCPDRIVTLGGDCLIDLAPMAYLNRRYGGNLGVSGSTRIRTCLRRKILSKATRKFLEHF